MNPMITETDITPERRLRLTLLEQFGGYTIEHVRAVCSTPEEMDRLLEGNLEPLAGITVRRKNCSLQLAALMMRQHHEGELARAARREEAEAIDKATPEAD